MAFKMKNPSLMKMAQKAGAGSPMKVNNDDKNKKTRMDGVGNTEEDISKAFQNKDKSKKKPKFTEKEISEYNKKLGIDFDKLNKSFPVNKNKKQKNNKSLRNVN